MSVEDLAVVGLQQIRPVAVQNARLAAGQRRAVFAGFDTVAGGLDADDAHVLVVEKRMEQPHGVRPTADAGDERIRLAAFGFLYLFANLVADDGLEVAHHGRIGMRAGDGTDDVEGILDVGDPVAQRLVHGVLQRPGAGCYRDDVGAQQLHPKDVGGLALDVRLAHVDDTRDVEQRAHRRRRHPVLSGPGFGDDPGLAHALGEQDLADGVVDLMRPGVVELVALEIDLGAAEKLSQAAGKIKRARPADVMLHLRMKLVPEGRIVLGHGVGLFDLQDQRHQGFGNKPAAIDAEVPGFVGARAIGVQLGHGLPRVLWLK